jgi:hypothetical protein
MNDKKNEESAIYEKLISTKRLENGQYITKTLSKERLIYMFGDGDQESKI